MIRINVKHRWDSAQYETQFRAAIRNAVSASALILQREMKQMLSRPGRGRLHAGLRYPSSLPGDPPTVQTGHLRRSVQVDLSGLVGTIPRARVGSNVPYGRWLEYGTSPYLIKARRSKLLVAGKGKKRVVFGRAVKHPGIKARPWVRPAIAAATPKIRARFTTSIEASRSVATAFPSVDRASQ